VTILNVDMMRLRHDRLQRVTAAFALALFLAGTHYCLVGDVASRFGARISCMAPASPASGSCQAHCGHAASTPARSAPRTATPPCCVALAPVVAVALVKIPVESLAPTLPEAPVALAAAPVPVSWCGYRVTRDTGPPPLHTRAPLASRAPPLA